MDLKNASSMSSLFLLIGVFVSLIIGFILMSPIFVQLNTAYTSTYVNGSTAVFHNNQPFISLIGLAYILAVVFIPLALLGLMAYKSGSKLFNLNETISRVVMILILIFVSVIVYLVLLPIVSNAYTSVSAYSWASSYLSLIQLSPLLFILGVFGIAIAESLKLFNVIA